jgi:hypothetical protein
MSWVSSSQREAERMLKAFPARASAAVEAQNVRGLFPYLHHGDAHFPFLPGNDTLTATTVRLLLWERGISDATIPHLSAPRAPS